MAVVTIKAGGRPGDRAKLIRTARVKASSLLAGDAERVLVVYGPQEATLHYEPVQATSSNKSS